MKNSVRQKVAEAAVLWATREIPPVDLPEIAVETPPASVVGDFASTLPLAVARLVRRSPRQVAQEMVGFFTVSGVLEKVEIAGPGFLNMTVGSEWLGQELRRLLDQREGYARRPSLKDQRVLLEFVSANPNGPLHVGHGRGAALGDSLARIFRHLGYDVTTEYYINNIGNQMENLAASVMGRVEELDPTYLDDEERVSWRAKPPADLYRGAYLLDVARDLLVLFPAGAERGRGLGFFREQGLSLVLKMIRHDLEVFGVSHDGWFPESALYQEGRMEKVFDTLRERGDLKEEEGALWFLSTRYGDDKDRVLKRADERPTYFASDIAYHDQKFSRGFSQLIDIWGTDHHGYVARVKASVQALGHDPNRLTILLYQLVTLVRGGKPVAMSTRTGEFVPLTEVVDEVGKDASRFFFALRSPNSHLEFDLDLAKKQASENPVFYVKYVHARCCSLFRETAKRGVVVGNSFKIPQTLHGAERTLLIRLASFPDVLDQCRRDLSPHHLTEYLLKLAGDFHRFYENCPILSGPDDLRPFRLALTDGVRTLIRNGLSLLGVDAPDEM